MRSISIPSDCADTFSNVFFFFSGRTCRPFAVSWTSIFCQYFETNVNIHALISFGVVFRGVSGLVPSSRFSPSPLYAVLWHPNRLIPFSPDTGIRTHDMKVSLSSSFLPSFIDWTSRSKRRMSHLARVVLYRFCGQIHGRVIGDTMVYFVFHVYAHADAHYSHPL